MSAGYVPFPAFAAWATAYDGSLVDGFAAQLDDARTAYGDAAADRAVEVASRYAAVDTGAIEGLYTTNRGFTRTIAERSAHWEAALAAHPEAEQHIRDALAGYEFVLDAVTAKRPVTAAWIRELHAVLLASQQTYGVYVEVGGQLHKEARQLVKGAYKTEPNFPTNPHTGAVHHYAPVEDTVAEMVRLVDELASAEFLAAHPVAQAAYAHYAFVCVHPFADGNGRVARALASVFLYRRPGVPLLIFADQTPGYLDALEAADVGRPEAFVSFVEQRAIDAVNLVLVEMSQAGRAVEDLGAAMRDDVATLALPARPGRLAQRVRGVLVVAVSDQTAALNVPAGITSRVHHEHVPGLGMARIRPPDAEPVRATVQWDEEPSCETGMTFEVAIADQDWLMGGPPSKRGPVLRVFAGPDGVVDELGVWLHDVYPAISQAFEHRLSAWVRGCLQATSNALAVLIREHRADSDPSASAR